MKTLITLLIVMIVLLFSCSQVNYLKFDLIGTYYDVNEEKTKNNYHPITHRITLCESDTFKYEFKWSMCYVSGEGIWSIDKDLLTLNSFIIEGIHEVDELKIENDFLQIQVIDILKGPYPCTVTIFNTDQIEKINDLNGFVKFDRTKLDSIHIKSILDSFTYKIKNKEANFFKISVLFSDLDKKYFNNEKWKIKSKNKIEDSEGHVLKKKKNI